MKSSHRKERVGLKVAVSFLTLGMTIAVFSGTSAWGCGLPVANRQKIGSMGGSEVRAFAFDHTPGGNRGMKKNAPSRITGKMQSMLSNSVSGLDDRRDESVSLSERRFRPWQQLTSASVLLTWGLALPLTGVVLGEQRAWGMRPSNSEEQQCDLTCSKVKKLIQNAGGTLSFSESTSDSSIEEAQSQVSSYCARLGIGTSSQVVDPTATSSPSTGPTNKYCPLSTGVLYDTGGTTATNADCEKLETDAAFCNFVVGSNVVPQCVAREKTDEGSRGQILNGILLAVDAVVAAVCLGECVAAKSEPTDPAPAVADPAPAVADPAPAVADPAPAVADPAPAVADPAPAVADPAPAVADPASPPFKLKLNGIGPAPVGPIFGPRRAQPPGKRPMSSHQPYQTPVARSFDRWIQKEQSRSSVKVERWSSDKWSAAGVQWATETLGFRESFVSIDAVIQRIERLVFIPTAHAGWTWGACTVAATIGAGAELIGAATTLIPFTGESYLTDAGGGQSAVRALSTILSPAAASAGLVVAGAAGKPCIAAAIFGVLAALRTINIFALQTTADMACNSINSLSSENAQAALDGGGYNSEAGGPGGTVGVLGGASGVGGGGSGSTGGSGSITSEQLSECVANSNCESLGFRVSGASNAATAAEREATRAFKQAGALPPVLDLSGIRKAVRSGDAAGAVAAAFPNGGGQFGAAVGAFAKESLKDPSIANQLASKAGIGSVATYSGGGGGGGKGGSGGSSNANPFASLFGPTQGAGGLSGMGAATSYGVAGTPEDIWHTGTDRNLFQIVSDKYIKVVPRVEAPLSGATQRK